MIRQYDGQMPAKVHRRVGPDKNEYNLANRTSRAYDCSHVILYDCATGKFSYPASLSEAFDAKFDERPFWDILKEDALCT